MDRDKLILKAEKSKNQNSYWISIFQLRKFADNEMIEKCFELINSENIKSKIIGLDTLSQLGQKRKKFSKKLINIIFELLQNCDDEKLIISCLFAIGHNNKYLTKRQIKFLEKFKSSNSKEIRYALAFSILALENEIAINILIKLSDDRSPKVRDWALFGLGTQIEVDTKEIRDVLFKHSFDKDDQAKQEAIKGLANRDDFRVNNIILEELNSENFGSLLFETIMQIKDGDYYLPKLKSIYEKSKNDKKINQEWFSDLENCINILENINVA